MLKRKAIIYFLIINYFNSIRHNKSITLNTLNDICSKLDCNVEDVIKYIPDKKKKS